MFSRIPILLSVLVWLPGVCWAGSAAGPSKRPALPGASSGVSREAAARVVSGLIEEARDLEDEAQRKPTGDDEHAELLSQAMSVLGRALNLDPHNAEARVALGRVLSQLAEGGGQGGHEDGEGDTEAEAEVAKAVQRSIQRSVQELYRARQDDVRGVFDCEISQLLGIVLSRLGRFQQAVDEYDRALLRLPGQPGTPSRQRSQKATILGNSAEALMALGRLPDAIRRYTEAEATETGDQAALHSLGLAVAYDRDGQGEKSRDALHRSLTTDPAMKFFQSDGVFFVPPGDRNYYVALLAEAFGDREAALSAWQQFLRELPKSRYAARAREHLAELRRTPGLSAAELQRAEVSIGEPLFPPERQASQLLGRRTRNEEEIGRTAQSHLLELRQCYARALRKNPRLTGEMEVALVLDRGGAVALAETIRNSMVTDPDASGGMIGGSGGGSGSTSGEGPAQAARELLRCTVDSMRRWRFPPSEAEHDELGLPLHFEVRR